MSLKTKGTFSGVGITKCSITSSPPEYISLVEENSNLEFVLDQ